MKINFVCTRSCGSFLTIDLKSVGLKQFLVAIGMTGVVAHVGRSHLGDVQRAIISKILPEANNEERESEKKGRVRERQTLTT